MDIGRLNKRITFTECTEDENKYDQTIQERKDYKTVWASVEPLTGRELLEANKNKNKQTFKIYIRYLEGINVNMQIKFKDRLMDITSISNYYENDKMMLIMCEENAGDSN